MTLRRLKAKYPDGAAGTAAEGASGRSPAARQWPASVVRDDSEPHDAGAAGPTRPIGSGGV